MTDRSSPGSGGVAAPAPGRRGAARARPRRFAPAEPAEHVYPEHLRDSLDSLPASPGVYVFHGEPGDLPLYIGKSVNLRSRVLSHLRNPEEARMLRQARSISHQRTAGEIGALLLEARMIKEQHPLFNQRLRRNRQLCSIRLDGDVPEIVHSKDIDFATESGLHGLFGSRHAAIEALRDIAREHRLCHGALGLERLAKGRPCFRAMLGQCAGACRGDETAQAHAERLRAALAAIAVACWPWPGSVGLVERDGNFVQIHGVRNWCYLGSAPTIEAAAGFDRVAPGFDADGYRILCGPVLRGEVEIVKL
jgi:excinuclease Cho